MAPDKPTVPYCHQKQITENVNKTIRTFTGLWKILNFAHQNIAASGKTVQGNDEQSI